MKTLQQLRARLVAYLFCKHTWYRVGHHGLPGEPHLMCCKKCQRLTKLDHYLTDVKRKKS